MARVWAAFLAVLAWVSTEFPAAAAPVRTANLEAELHSARAAIAPGERFVIVLRQTLNPGWHTYWRNPGAAGQPTEIVWRLPAGFVAGDISWPTPTTIPVESLVNYGYSGEVLLPIEIAAPTSLRAGDSVTLNASATWVVCSDICVPERGDFSLILPVAAQGRDDATWAPRIRAALAALPTPFDPAGPLRARISPGRPPRLSVAFAGEILREPYFFPNSRDAANPSAPQNPSFGPAGVSLELPGGADEGVGKVGLAGIFTFVDSGGARRAYEVQAEPGDPLPDTSGAPPPAPTMDAMALLAAIGLAFLGGLILNIMPCVLPVLSVKALSLAGGVHAGEVRRHGALYFVGVMATFLALAAVLIALRSGGDALGWGYQFQAPWVNAGLALLFFAIGLNLLGVFQVGGFENFGAGLAQRGGDVGAFSTGALAVVAATPCTAPFMAGAIGTALTQSAGVTLLIFAALALGFALPFTALSFASALQRLIPKPGPWMERAKNVLAFPMFAAAIWLAWVHAEQTEAGGVLALLSLAAALAFALVVGRWGRVWVAASLAVLALTGAIVWRPLVGAQTQETLVSEAWSPARVEALRAEGRPIFVNFTAAWCVTCKVNELAALSSQRVAQAFEGANVAYLKADWTNRDEAIAGALASFGRAGVPLYLYYPPAGAPVLLPQVLSEGLILETIEGRY